MKHFTYLKQVIKNALEDENYNEVDFEGTTFKEVIIGRDVNYDKQLENTDSITLNTDNLIINGNGHIVNLNHHSDAFHVAAENVIIKNFNFLNGKGFDGGAIKNTGVLKIDNCTFTNWTWGHHSKEILGRWSPHHCVRKKTKKPPGCYRGS